MKQTKELQNIFKAIDKWVKKHKGSVNFVGSFMAFDENKDFEVIDDGIVGFGNKKGLLLAITDLKKMAKDEGEFINW